MDKNHPGNGINSSIDSIKTQVPHYALKVVGLINKEKECIKYKGRYYPFSYSTVLYCIKRVLQRKVHSTLSCENEEDEVKAAHVVMFFMKLYENFYLTASHLEKYGIYDIIEIAYTPTIPSIPPDLLASFHQLIEKTRNNN